MKPLNLTATNFRSYPELDVPLSELELATLCGENGAGKSSVLKAMLFGLFGPEPGLSQDDYIRTGQQETRVEFDFQLNGSNYRVIRARKFNGKTGKTTLEFQQHVRNSGQDWQPITGDTIAQTQDRINEVLCLDQDGFLKSAWISQGDADAFTRAKPTERKNVLAGILDLDVYKRLQDAAKKRLRSIEDEIEKLRGKLEHVEAQMAGKASTEAALKEAREKAATYQYGIKSLEEKLEQLRATAQELSGITAKREAFRQQKDAAGKTLFDLVDSADRLVKQADSLCALQEQVPDLEAKASRRSELQASIAEQDQVAARWNEVNQQRLELRSQWQEANAEQARLSDELLAEEKRHEQVIRDRDALVDKLVVLEVDEVHHCPTCQQEIKDTALEATRQTYQGQIDEIVLGLALTSARIESLTEAQQKAHEPLAALEAKGKELPEVEYDRDAHKRLKTELDGLDGIDGKLAEARSAATRVAELKDENATLAEQITAKTKEVEDLDLQLAETDDSAQQLASTNTEIFTAESKLTETRKSHEAVAADVTRHQAELERLARLEEESTGDRRRRGELQATAATWQYLVNAFGKDGIPALIIDAAIPEVEDTANDILHRLGTGLEVKLETQKTLKSSDGIRETLDVKIIEDGFERPYETYSGGEAYRVNVALRVALSKLLARRAGAHIETLILDEPEGLDEDGRAKLVELLQILSETFGTILLISHHEDLKEVFPARIECRKGPEGSSAEVVFA